MISISRALVTQFQSFQRAFAGVAMRRRDDSTPHDYYFDHDADDSRAFI